MPVWRLCVKVPWWQLPLRESSTEPSRYLQLEGSNVEICPDKGLQWAPEVAPFPSLRLCPKGPVPHMLEQFLPIWKLPPHSISSERWKLAVPIVRVVRPVCRTNESFQQDALCGDGRSAMDKCPAALPFGLWWDRRLEPGRDRQSREGLPRPRCEWQAWPCVMGFQDSSWLRQELPPWVEPH